MWKSPQKKKKKKTVIRPSFCCLGSSLLTSEYLHGQSCLLYTEYLYCMLLISYVPMSSHRPVVWPVLIDSWNQDSMILGSCLVIELHDDVIELEQLKRKTLITADSSFVSVPYRAAISFFPTFHHLCWDNTNVQT